MQLPTENALPGRSWSSTGSARVLRLPCGDVHLNVRIEGHGPPILLLHGYPQTHRMWRRVLPRLSSRHTVILPDLRGYGDSDKPPAGPNADAYSKRAMANDLVALLDLLHIPRCPVIAHDRGARVAHRLALDHPDLVPALALIDILPTLWHDQHPDRNFIHGYWHWPFLAAGEEAERLIGLDPDAFLLGRLRAWSRTPDAFAPEDLADYLRCFRDPACRTATCADYRAAAGIDLDHDRADSSRKLECPVGLLWGTRGFIGTHYDPPSVWSGFASQTTAFPLNCGHFPAEELPDETGAALLAFSTSFS